MNKERKIKLLTGVGLIAAGIATLRPPAWLGAVVLAVCALTVYATRKANAK